MNSLSSIFDQGVEYGNLEDSKFKFWDREDKDPILTDEQKAQGFTVGTDLVGQFLTAWGQKNQSIDENRQPYPVTPPPPTPPDYSGIIIAGIVSALLLGGTFAYLSSRKEK